MRRRTAWLACIVMAALVLLPGADALGTWSGQVFAFNLDAEYDPPVTSLPSAGSIWLSSYAEIEVTLSAAGAPPGDWRGTYACQGFAGRAGTTAADVYSEILIDCWLSTCDGPDPCHDVVNFWLEGSRLDDQVLWTGVVTSGLATAFVSCQGVHTFGAGGATGAFVVRCLW